MVWWEIFSHLPIRVSFTQTVEVDRNHTHKYAGNSIVQILAIVET